MEVLIRDSPLRSRGRSSPAGLEVTYTGLPRSAVLQWAWERCHLESWCWGLGLEGGSEEAFPAGGSGGGV